MHVLALAAVSYGLWLLLSGHYDVPYDVPLLLGLGALAVVLVVTIARRMDRQDRKGQPVRLSPKSVLYWPWLAWQIVKANLDVARRIISPGMPIRPTLIRVNASQKSELGRVIYANSITLTPGTVSINVDGNTIEVHALTREAAQDLRRGEMDRRVREAEGGK